MKTTMKRRFTLLAAGLLLSTSLPSLADDLGYDQIHYGEATGYGGGPGGQCSFPLPDDLPIVAMNHTDYAGSQACGACVEITRPETGKTVIARVDNRCPECAPGDIDMSDPAFLQIGTYQEGRFPISWKYIPCSYASMSLFFKEGSSQWWTAVQVRDARYPVKSLEYRRSNGDAAYKTLPREMYNYFLEAGGMGEGPYDFRITDVFGHVVEAKGIALVVTTPIVLNQQFETSPEPVPAACADGIDNDGDGNTDYPADSGCTSASDDDEAGAVQAPAKACFDNIDNDGDGLIDYPTDLGCDSADDDDESGPTTTPPASEATVALRIDNDWGNGYCATVTVANPGSTALTWNIALNVEGTLYTAWNATWSQDGATLTASGVNWNATLAAGASTEFGYCANR